MSIRNKIKIIILKFKKLNINKNQQDILIQKYNIKIHPKIIINKNLNNNIIIF